MAHGRVGYGLLASRLPSGGPGAYTAAASPRRIAGAARGATGLGCGHSSLHEQVRIRHRRQALQSADMLGDVGAARLMSHARELRAARPGLKAERSPRGDRLPRAGMLLLRFTQALRTGTPHRAR